jgi:Reverse transcriptase (RNA-dependent DNA polymerase)
MAEPKSGEPFGLDQVMLKVIDWNLALERIIHDLRSDFIYAPHFAFIYRRAGLELIEALKSELKAGTFFPGMPLTIEVPKSHRLRVAAPSKRFGPSFSRPGSILPPKERLFYQALADQAASIIDAKTDHQRSFSHKLSPGGSSSMFQPTRTCWGLLQAALKKHALNASTKYIVKIDISNFFGSLNQHTLINVLADSGYQKPLASRLELLLTSFIGERSSRGILQGIYPSDLFGNFYMAPVDRFLKELGHPSARYVDDLYVFVESVEASNQLMRELIPFLRSYDLVLNEAKCVIMAKNHLITEEPDLEALFADAVEEISNQVNDDDFDADYGLQSEWDDEKKEGDPEKSLELKATEVLFGSIETYSGHEESIERFCLPMFAKAGSDYAVSSVMDSFKKRPAMTQIYSSYLAKFIASKEIPEFLVDLLRDPTLNDWQKMWILAALLQVKPNNDDATDAAVKILKDANRHDAVRAIAAIYIGRYGDLDRRKALVTLYPKVAHYIQAAIYFSSLYWKGVERSNAKANWGSHGILSSLLTTALAKKPL